MASAARVTVETTAILLASNTQSRGHGVTGVAVYNAGAGSVYLGGLAVTSAAGLEVAAAGRITIDLAQGESLYAISASGSNICHVLTVNE